MTWFRCFFRGQYPEPMRYALCTPDRFDDDRVIATFRTYGPAMKALSQTAHPATVRRIDRRPHIGELANSWVIVAHSNKGN